MNKLLILVSVLVIFGVINAEENQNTVKTILNNFMEGSPKELFKVWHLLFTKNYTLDTEEAKQRFGNFKANLLLIKAHNAKNLSYTLGLNQFSDMSNAEYKSKMCTKKNIKGKELDMLLDELNMKPAFLEDDDDDLTKRNLRKTTINHLAFFGPVRNQGSCGSCWAFSTAGAIEGAFAFKNKAVISLSPQQLVDCDTSNSGCNGGDFGLSFKYATTNGVMLDSAYSYTSAVGTCKFNKSLVKITPIFKYCSNYSNYASKRCSTDITINLLVQGPISIGIDAGTQEFQNYSSGTFTANCTQDNHAVIAVGYGNDGTNDYFLVRNSWGKYWGENGYIKVAVNEQNNYSCFVTNESYLPLA